MKRICGIDEAGRGPLAGPVTAAAVVFAETGIGCRPADSKSISARHRATLETEIRSAAAAWGIGWSWPEEIDAVNIHHASLVAMQRAFQALCNWVYHCSGATYSRQLFESIEIQVDGRFAPRFDVPCSTVIGGDRIVPEIQAASILAKVARDRWMCRYNREEPQYGFDRHMGYPTDHHRRMVLLHGPSRIQRRSFAVREPDCAGGSVTSAAS